jgi:hypothetical protein
MIRKVELVSGNLDLHRSESSHKVVNPSTKLIIPLLRRVTPILPKITDGFTSARRGQLHNRPNRGGVIPRSIRLTYVRSNQAISRSVSRL